MLQIQPLWTRNFFLICLANLMIFSSFYFLLPTLPVYVTDILHGDEANGGYIIGVLSLTAVLVRPLSGFLLDAVGRKKILIIALVAFSLSMAAYNLIGSLAVLLVLRAIHGVFWGFATTGAGTIASDVVPPARIGEGLGYYGVSNTLAMAAGPSLGLFILGTAGFSALFNSSFIVALAGLACVLFISYRENKPEKKVGISLESFFEPRVFFLSWIMFFTALVYGGIVSFITLYGKDIGIKNAGTYFLAYSVTLLFIRPLAGRYFDKNGSARIMAVGFIAIALSFVLLFAAKGIFLFLLSAVAMGVGFGIVMPTAMAMAVSRVAPYRRGAACGTIFSAFDLGIGLGSILLGFFSKVVGLSYTYLSCSFIILITMVLFYFKYTGELSQSPEYGRPARIVDNLDSPIP